MGEVKLRWIGERPFQQRLQSDLNFDIPAQNASQQLMDDLNVLIAIHRHGLEQLTPAESE